MALISQTLEHIRAVMLARLAGSPALVEYDTSPGSPWWLLCNAVAQEAYKQAIGITSQALNCVPSTATGDALWEWVRTFLGEKIEGTEWVGFHVLHAEAGQTPIVPIGTEIVHADGTAYQTTAAVAAVDWSGPGGNVTVASIATTMGTIANKAIGTNMAVVAPPVGCQMTCQIGATTTPGTDDETEDSARLRLRAELSGRPGSGKPADFVSWALDGPVAGIDRVCVYPRYTTPLEVLVVCCGTDAQNGMISAADAARIEAHLVTEAQFAADVYVPHILGAPPRTLTEIRILPEFTVRAEPGWDGDWTFGAFAANIGVGSLAPRIQLTANPIGSIAAGQHVVVSMNHGGMDDYRYELEVTNVGANWVETLDWPELGGAPSVPVPGTALEEGGPLYQPIRNAITAFFATRGPWPVDPLVVGAPPVLHRQRYPESATKHCGAVNMSDLTSVIDGVTGVESVTYDQFYRSDILGVPQPIADLREVVDPTVPTPICIYTEDTRGPTIAWA